jgi:hypothetical protein
MRLRAFVRRWSFTLATLMLLGGLALITALSLLWRPFIFIVLGALVLVILRDAVRQDRQRRDRTPE